MRAEKSIPPATPNGNSVEALLTKKEMADYFKVTPRCIAKWMAGGVLVYFKLGRKVRFRLSDVQDHLAKNNRVCRRFEGKICLVK